MSLSVLKGKTVPVRMWTKVEEIESAALDQLKNIAALPWVFKRHHCRRRRPGRYSACR